MKELKVIAGKDTCGKNLDMRITDCKDDKGEPVAWIVYGICKKCNLVLISDLFIQEEEPVQGVDFVVDYDKAVKK